MGALTLRPGRVAVSTLVAGLVLILAGCGSVTSDAGAGESTPSRSSAVGGTNPWSGRRVVAVTHNGGEQQFPQDTMFALRQAQVLGMQILDVDVQLSEDGVPVLIHSATVQSSTNGAGVVSDFTAAQLARLDAGHWWVPGCGTSCKGRPDAAYPDRGVRTGVKPLPAGATSRDEFAVPTLKQVFEAFPAATIDIELKPDTDSAAQVAALIAEFHRADRTIVASFDDKQIARFKALAPEVPTSPGKTASTKFFLGGAPPPGFQVLQLPYRQKFFGVTVTVVTPDLIERAPRGRTGGLGVGRGGTTGTTALPDAGRPGRGRHPREPPERPARRPPDRAGRVVRPLSAAALAAY